MTTQPFRALRMLQDESGIRPHIGPLTVDDLSDGDTLVWVRYSSLNYKDGLAVMGRPGVLRRYPMIPGIDLAGEVISGNGFTAGEQVLLTGWGIGERTDGGYTQVARVRGESLVRLPVGTDPLWAMSVGTAGFTAMLAVMSLEAGGVAAGTGEEVLVTGAAGGVGSVAVNLLSKAGYQVTASTGRREEEEYLQRLGASRVIDRAELTDLRRPLEKERWAGAVDTVGGDTLTGVLASTRTHGVVAACGNAGGAALHTTVFPFILRGVTLAGIDSNTCPAPQRRAAWERLARDLDRDLLREMTRVYPLDAVPDLAAQILAGQIRGRTVIDLGGEEESR